MWNAISQSMKNEHHSMMPHYICRRVLLKYPLHADAWPTLSCASHIMSVFCTPTDLLQFFILQKGKLFSHLSFKIPQNILVGTSGRHLTNFFIIHELPVCSWALPCLHYSLKYRGMIDIPVIWNIIVSRPPVIHFIERKQRDLKT